MPAEPRFSRRKLIRGGLSIGGFAIVGDAFGLEPEWIQVERVEVPIKGLGSAFDGYRIALFSDIHWPRRIDRAYLSRVIGLANSFKPDLVAIPGDLCDRAASANVPDLSGLYDGLQARDGVVGTLGNHDHMFDVPALKREVARNTPIQLLDNRHRMLRRGNDRLAIGGVGDLYFQDVAPLLTFQGVSPEIPRIMLSHNPDVAEDEILPIRVDLQLSGHTHGGEVRVPFGPAPHIPSKYGQKFRSGLVQGRSHRVYVTRGICSIRRVRFFCRPEVTHLTLRSA